MPDSKEPRPPRPEAARTGSRTSPLAIRAPRGQLLRTPQIVFNHLLKRIRMLRRQSAKERERLEELLQRLLLVVGPIETELARRQYELAHALSAANERWPLGKRETESMRRLLLGLLRGAFAVTPPNDTDLALHARWFTPEQRSANAAAIKRLRNEFRQEFGYDAEIPDGCEDSIQGFERFRETLEEQVRRADEEAERRSHETQGRSRSRKARRIVDQEQVRVKSVRAIYLLLAKSLHPDANAQATGKKEREADMKRAAEAYRKEDLLTLLELEQRWSGTAGRTLDAVGDDLVEVYLATLRRNLKDLSEDLRRQASDPRFRPIAPLARLTRVKALATIDAWAEDVRGDLARVEKLFADLAACRGKRDLAKLVGDCLGDGHRQRNAANEHAFDDEDDDRFRSRS